MNLHKEDPLLAEFERSLGRILSNWSRRYSPKRDARAQLLLAAAQIQNERSTKLQNFLETRPQGETNSHELAVLFYAPQLSYLGALIHY